MRHIEQHPRLARWYRAIGLGLALWLAGAGAALAATYTVTTVNEGIGNCTGLNCTTLRAAINTANAAAGADTIVFSASLAAGSTVNLTSVLPVINSQITLDGDNRITLSSGGGSFRMFLFNGAAAGGSQLRNFNLTFTNERLVQVSGAPDVVIDNNMLSSSSTFDPITVVNSDNVTVSNNIISGGSSTFGIYYYNTFTISGYSGTITGNTVTTSGFYGIGLLSVQGVTVSNNVISGATQAGVRLQPQYDGGDTNNNLITGNTISGNARGVWLGGGTSVVNNINNNRIENNVIVNNSGTGIELQTTASQPYPTFTNTTISGNIINTNTTGIRVVGNGSANNAIYANSIGSNSLLGIDLGTLGVTPNDAGDTDSGPNGLQNFPITTRVSGGQVGFVLDTQPNANGFRIDFYNNTSGVDSTGYGEGQTHLGSCQVATVSATVPTLCSVSGADPSTLRMTATRCQTAGCATSTTQSIGATSEFNRGTAVDLSITKTNGQTLYSTGQNVTYTIVVSNIAGSMGTVFDAAFTDPAVAGLNVTAVTCGSATGGSVCPTAGNTTVALMQGSGILVPELTVGGSVTFTVSATVTATGGNLTNTAAIAVPSGLFDFNTANNTASDTDSNRPLVILRKTTTGGAGGPFGFTLTNTGQTTGTVTTTAADTPTQVDGDGAAGVQPFVVTTPGGNVTINESSVAATWTFSTATCVNASSVVVGSLSGTTYTIPGSATANGAVITCTFTNNAQTRLRLRKALPDGRLNVGDQFVLSINGAGGPATATTTGNTGAPTEEAVLGAATPGTPYTLAEAGSGGASLASYVTTYSCTNALAGGQTPSGSGTSFSVTPAAGDDLSCVFTNAWPRANLSVLKIASPSAVATGGLAGFTLTVSNAGPNAANGAVLRDAPAAGLDCTEVGLAAPTCVASGGAACPGGLTNAALLGA
ncbi:MAG: prealbumin-like fold domain-containing protein, partial [Hydrogenophaga sp.]|uniref:prealbumin-like fold domain-containing protein n=2 Tax=Hydrogenophaga sp. TaxID=1904254 RepID=UPI00403528A0